MKKLILLVIGLMVCASTGWGVACDIQGRVTDSVLGTGIAGVDVIIGSVEMVTDATGDYTSTGTPFTQDSVYAMYASVANYTAYGSVVVPDANPYTNNFTLVHDPVYTPTNTPTATPTSTPTQTPTNTPSNTPTETNTATETPTVTPTVTPSSTPSNTPTNTPSNTPTDTPTNTPTPTITNTPSNTPTVTPTPTISNTPTRTPTKTPTPLSAETPITPSTLTKVSERDRLGYAVWSQVYTACYESGAVAAATPSRVLLVDLTGNASYPHTVGRSIVVESVEAFGYTPQSATATLKIGVCSTVDSASGDVSWFLIKPQLSGTDLPSRQFSLSETGPWFPSYLTTEASSADQSWASSSYGALPNCAGSTTATADAGDIVGELNGQFTALSITVRYRTR